MLMGAGGLGSENGEGFVLGAGAGIGAGGDEDPGAGANGAGVAAGPDPGAEITPGDEGGPIGIPGSPPIIGIMPYAPGGPEGA
jgi:hypothetical protein